MENRFGIKDLALFSLVLIVIVLVALSMQQVDRQWKQIRELQDGASQNARDLRDIRNMLAQGVNVNNASGSSTTQPTTGTALADDPFKPIKDAEKMPGFARGDWFIHNFGAKLKAITPFVGNDVPAAWVQAKVQEGMFYRDVDSLELVPLLAKSWTISPDGLTITFNLRRGVAFSDGEPMTADDVIFTFDWIRNPAVNAPRDRGSLDQLASYRKVDDYTVEFKFKEYYFMSLETVGGEPVLPKHFYSKYTPDQFNETPGLLMGTGPYRLSDPAAWKPGDKMELIRNERYWGELPAPDRLVYLEVEEEAAEQTMFTNGELDEFAATAEQYNKMKEDPRVLAIAKPLEFQSVGSGYTFVAWNEKSGTTASRFADKRVRQAMTMLIDRESLAKQVFLGYASVANGPFSAASKQADPAAKPWPYDPERAKKLLADLGYRDRNGDGVLDGPDGKPFTFKLTYPNKMATYDRITLFMKDGFAKAGIIMERDPVEWPLLQQKLDRRDFDAIVLAWSSGVEDDPHQTFDSSQIADQGDNFIAYNSPEFDAALKAARGCVNDAQRTELWHKVHRILAEDQPYTFMFNRKSTYFINNRWQNVRESKMGLNYYKLDCSPMPWFVSTTQQKYTK